MFSMCQGDVRKFELAYKHCKDAQDRDQVDAAQADFYFKTGWVRGVERGWGWGHTRTSVQPLTPRGTLSALWLDGGVRCG